MKNRTWEDIQLIEAVSQSTSMGQVLDKLKLHRTGGNYTSLRRHINRLRLNTSHWLGQGHMKGKSSHNKGQRMPIEKLASGSSLRQRVLGDNLIDYHCAICGIDNWLGDDLSLRLDHINGIYNDNRLENLRWLCPNCDSQCPTFAGRNRKRAPVPELAAGA